MQCMVLTAAFPAWSVPGTPAVTALSLIHISSRFGLMVTDENDKITAFQEKPKEPKSNLASMGIYIFNWDVLKKYLIEDEADPESENDFGKNVIPSLLRDGRDTVSYTHLQVVLWIQKWKRKKKDGEQENG